MGFFSEIDIEIREMIADGATRKQVRNAYPMLREDEVDMYFDDDHDGDIEGIEDNDDWIYEESDNDGQPTEYEEWQDLYGGDDFDHGQYDEAY